MHSLFIIFCFFFFRCVFATNETKFGSDADEGTFGNGTMAKAQQSPRIKWTDEEKPTADELLQSTQLFRTANAKRFQSLMSSNEERATRDEAARLRSVTKEVEEKLGLAPSPGTNRQGPTTFGITDLYPSANDPPALLRRFVGTGESAVELKRIRPPPNALVASLLRQQRELSAVQPNIIRPSVGTGTFIAQQQRQQQHQLEYEQQRLVEQQQQLQTLLQQLATVQRQRQLQQQQMLMNSQRQSGQAVQGRNERLASRASSSSSSSSRAANIEKFSPPFASPSFFGPANNPFQPPPPISPPSSSSALFPGKFLPSSASAFRLPGGLPSPTAPIFGGVQPSDSKFAVQPSPISAPFRPISSSVDSAADLSALLQKLSWNNPTNQNSGNSATVVVPIPTSLSNAANRGGAAQFVVPKPQQERPLVVKLVAAGKSEQQSQQQNPNNNNNNGNDNTFALQQIVLQEQQRIVELLAREQYREQLVQNSRKELQTVQDQQQRILELLAIIEKEKQQQQQQIAQIGRLSRANGRRTVPKETTESTTTMTTSASNAQAAPTQQQSLADSNLLRGLLQAFSNLLTPQATASGGVSPSSSAFVPPTVGQQQQQVPNIGGTNNFGKSRFVGVPQPQQQQVQAVQQQSQPQQIGQPNSAVQFVAVYEPWRMAQQQQQINGANFITAATSGDGAVPAQSAAVLPQEVGAVGQLQQQFIGSSQPVLPQLPQQQQQQVGAVSVLGWLPTRAGENNAFSADGLFWPQQQQQLQQNNFGSNNDNGNDILVQRRTAQRRREDGQQTNGEEAAEEEAEDGGGAAERGEAEEEEGEERRREGDEVLEDTGKWGNDV